MIPLDQLTVLIITFNEEANIARTLDGVAWARQILLIDSGSSDETIKTASSFSQVRIVERAFTDFADQCNFGLSLIKTRWTLSIDADYVFPSDCQAAIDTAMQGSFTAYEAAFDYWIHGKAVRGSILPGRTVLYETQNAKYYKDGHGHRVDVNGTTGKLPFRIAHDDRKPLSRWLQSQIAYARQEAEKIITCPVGELGRNDRIRKATVLAPVLVFLLVYVLRGGFISGWRGLFYALQRFLAEILLSLFLLDRKLSGNDSN